MPHSSHGNRTKRKRKNSNPTKNARYKAYESPNKDPPKMATGGGELVNEVNRECSERSVINEGESRHLLTLNDEVIETESFLRPPPAHSNTLNRPDWVNEIFTRLLHIEQKIEKFNQISASVAALTQRVNSVEGDLDNLKKTSGNIGNSIGALRKTTEEVKGQIHDIQRAQSYMDDTITDLQCRSMRDNLLFFGLAEYRGENRENCSNLIDDFCEAELGIKEVGQHIERAHRLGKKNIQSENPRPIVVKFSTYRMREKVREQTRRLAGTHFNIQEQFPKKVQEKRKQLIPIMKEARRNRKMATLVKDKLYIDGVEYIPGTAETEDTRM